jgi:hypothetical protein
MSFVELDLHSIQSRRADVTVHNARERFGGLAALIPAIRAARIDPAVSLRAD